MGIRNASVVFVLLAVGCATAVSTHESGSVDAGADPSAIDSRSSDPTSPDAPTVASPDAPPSSGCAFSGALASWSFAGQPGSETSIAATSSAPGVTAGALTRAASLTATSGSGSINASGWSTTTQLVATKYYTVSLTPPSGCTLDIASIAIDAKSSSTGPTKAAMATSADNFAQTTSVSTTAASTPSISISGVNMSLEIRIFGYAASGTSGTMRLQNTLTVTGSLH